VNASEVRNERIGLKAGSLALLAVVLWGGNSVSIKIGLAGMPPVAMAGARFLLGALTVAVGALLSGIPLRVPTTRWTGLAGLGLLFCVQIALLNVGTHLTNASRSTVLICTYPFFTAFFAHFMVSGDRLSASKVTGLLLSFAGVVLVFAESLGTGYLLGDALVLISGMLLGLRQVVIKRLVSGLHPFQVVFWQAALSLPVFAGASALFERHTVWEPSPSVIGAVLFQGVVIAGFCFILMASLLKRHRASTLGAFGFVTPIFGGLLSVRLRGEELSWRRGASLVLVAIGIIVVNREEGESPI